MTTFEDFYWIEKNKTVTLYFNENSMPCAHIYSSNHMGETIWHSELWVYKVGRDLIKDESLDVLKLKTIIRADQMIKDMKEEILDREGRLNLRKQMAYKNMYSSVIPQIATNYFRTSNLFSERSWSNF